MGFQEEAIKYHDYLEQAMKPYVGEFLKKKAIIKILLAKFPELKEKSTWVLSSDHCINHTNKAACTCSMKDNAIFERVGYGKYRVL